MTAPEPLPQRLVLVKLGGSVLTKKTTLGGIRYDNLRRIAKEIAHVQRAARVVLVHGGGSFGHPLARLYHIYGRGRRTRTAPNVTDRRWRSEGASAIQRSMLRLNAAFVSALADAGIAALSVPGGVLAELYDGELEAFHPGSIERYLAAGLTPVSFGDVAPDRHQGLAIVSGDTLILALAEAIRPDLVIFATDQDGIFDRDPDKDRNALLQETLDAGALRALAEQQAGGPDAVDATGGMVHKMNELADIADLGVASLVISGFAPGRLEAAIKGDAVLGTSIPATTTWRRQDVPA